MDQQQFEQAQRLAEHAEELDCSKGSLEPHLQYQAISVAREMHKLAEAMAGDRLDEIYAPSDMPCGWQAS